MEFMNINVAQIKGHYDAFNLDDALVGAPGVSHLNIHDDALGLKAAERAGGTTAAARARCKTGARWMRMCF